MRREQQARDLAAEFPELEIKGAAEKLAAPGGLVTASRRRPS
jgi:hypothetical protein